MTFDEWWKVVYRYGSDVYNAHTRAAFAECWAVAHATAVCGLGSAVEDRLNELQARLENLEAENAVLRESVPTLPRATKLPSVFCEVCHAELTGDPHYHCPACGELCAVTGCFNCHEKDGTG